MELPALNRDTLGSPYAIQLKAGFANLKFSGLLEKEFREFYTSQNLPRARLSGLIALILVLAVTCIDLIFGASAISDRVNTLRLTVLCPSLVLMVVAAYLPSRHEFFAPVVGTGTLVIGLTVIYICHVSALEGASYVLSGVLLVNLYAMLFLGLLFGLALTISSTLLVAHVTIGMLIGLPMNELLYMTAMIGTSTVIGAISTYNLEYAHRTNFLETRLLNELAERDGLTGLYNRRIFDDFIRRLWRQSRREEAPVAIIFVDIDYFKVYNDLHGHQAGDDCLKKVAGALARGAKRPFDFCARYGGEEFVLVLYGPPTDYAHTLAEQIREDVMNLAIAHEGSGIADCVTVSIGVGLAHPASGRSLTGAIQTADEALYEAKQKGRNRVVLMDAGEVSVETGNFRAAYREVV